MQRRVKNGKSTTNFRQSRTTFSTPKPRRSFIKNRHRGSQNKKFFYKISIFLVLSLFTFFSVYNFSKAHTFNEEIKSVISGLDNNCKNYSYHNSLKSYLNITLSQDEKIQSIILSIYDNSKILNIDFTNTQFKINKDGALGDFNKYFSANNVYLNQQDVFKNMSALFLREFYLKVDHVIVSSSSYDLATYIKDQAASEFSKDLNQIKANPIQTDMCIESWSEFIGDITTERLNSKDINYSADLRINKYFEFIQLKKEQIRVHLSNNTGVESFGGYMKRLFENYGINVIKVDNSPNVKIDSSIQLEDSSMKESSSFKQISSLIDGIDNAYEITTSNNIFADIYMEVGQDLLIK